CIEISVADSGRGIHPEDLPRVFDRFYQSRQKGALTEGGTGIGLALSRELMKMMEGKIGVESTLEEGSKFWIQLPRKEVLGIVPVETDETVAASEMEVLEDFEVAELAQGNPAGDQKSILIVEDNYSLREYLGMILGNEYPLHIAKNGKIALDWLESRPPDQLPDLILSDIMMPQMDGYQLLTHLKSDERFRRIPVIMLTARAAIEDKLQALRIGVDDYLLKPFQEEELRARIDNLLRHAEDRTKARMAATPSGETTHESETISPSQPIDQASQEDQIWLKKLEDYVAQHLESDLLSVAQIAAEFAVSSSTLQRKIKHLVGLSPIKYIQEHRLNTARELLETRRYNTVAQVAYKVGFKNPKAFTRSFRQRFGTPPSQFF
ncbi:MAG: response regulator, partial [Bacteroidota bacterium]